MTSIQSYKDALIAAHQSGDKEGAKLIAQAIAEADDTQKSDIPLAFAAPMQFVEGATQGFSDEISGGLGAAMSYPASLVSDRVDSETEGMSFGDRYDLYRGRALDRQNEINEAYPNSQLVSETSGTITGAAIPASKGLTFFKGAKNIPQLMKAGAAEGAVYSGINAAGRSDEGGLDRAKQAGINAPIGATVGGVLPLAINPLSSIAQAFMTRFKPAPEQAANRVYNVARKAGKTPEQITSELDNLGDDSMLIDVLGAPGKNLGRATVNADGAAEDILLGATQTRQSGQNERIGDKLLQAGNLDQPQTLTQITDAINTANRPAITKAYESARNAGQDVPLMQFRDLMNLPMFQNAVKKARKSQANYLAFSTLQYSLTSDAIVFHWSNLRLSIMRSKLGRCFLS